MRVAYSRGRYQNQMNSLGEYFYYSATMDGDTRPSHAQLHGTILKKDHPFWDTHYPPNAWRCRCKVRVYTKDELKARGLSPSNIAPPSIAHKDWSYNPGKKDNIQEVYKDKAKNTKGSISRAVKQELKDDLKYLKQNDKLFSDIKALFVTKKPKTVELCKSDMFGAEKRVLLSSDTVQSHLDRKNITAYDYSLMPDIVDGRVFKQKENTFVIIKKYGKYYRAALKDVKDKDEIFLVSLIGANSEKDYEKWVRELDKFEEIKKGKR